MPQPPQVTKATLTEIKKDQNNNATEVTPPVPVQFNPQSLKLTYSNRTTGGAEGKSPGAQVPGRNSTRLSMELWFDVTALPDLGAGADGGAALQSSSAAGTNDVRALTGAVSYFMQHKAQSTSGAPPVPPELRFQWGTFLFYGVMESMDETLEYFSADGRPLRASVSISLSKEEIEVTPNTLSGLLPGLSPGGSPLYQARAGDSLQQAAARAGLTDWKAIAAGNGIENPRLLAAGAVVDLAVRAPSLSAGASASVSLRGSLGASARASFGASFGASAGAGVAAGLTVGASASVSARGSTLVRGRA